MSGIRVDQNILNQKGTPAFYAANYFDRPAAGFVGRIFISVNTSQIFRDEGTGWSLIADTGSGSSNLEQVTLNGNNTPYGINITNGGLFLLGSANGSIFFASGGSGQFTTDNANFFWDDTNNRLGIGTATPSAKLDVHSSSGTSVILNGTGVSNALLTFQSAGTSKWSVGNFVSSTVANDFNIYDNVNTVSRLQVHNTGVVNIPTTLIIGSTTPTSSYALDVTGIAKISSTLTLGTITSGSVLFAGSGGLINQNNSQFFWDNTNNRLGIGTSSPIALLNIYGSTHLQLQNATTGSTSTDGTRIQLSGNDLQIINRETADTIFYTSDTERMHITSGGNLQITTAAASLSFFNTTQNVAIQSSNDTTIRIRTLLTSQGQLSVEGLAGVGSRTVLADGTGLLSAPVSDISVKENIVPIGYGLNEIIKMNPVWYNFIDEFKNNGEGRQNGNIAQEMKEIIPEAVFITPSTGKMGIEYSQLHAVYIKAFQELNEKLVRNNIN